MQFLLKVPSTADEWNRGTARKVENPIKAQTKSRDSSHGSSGTDTETRLIDTNIAIYQSDNFSIQNNCYTLSNSFVTFLWAGVWNGKECK